ncbi:mandelate racemase/muconate lactonizing enzyme family protein [Halomonas nitroreducens]|uniref:Mandelate racemase/muconate lactonizing enzyme family protein n=1 Tax=Halomonas nitroreducens TaxID=447425 RepID=A0A3S0K0W6_9GAMM|nr:mandelate racemase/muconate lactonizing enzyme family protein [Halomonas nitroreducens]RTQ99584.1 mandelate racemase/muconate lactonizing enzyme family protein [Halomonas nitroreducens]
MIIQDIHVYTMSSELPQPFAFSQQWVQRRSATIVQVVTRDGASGWGEALCAGLLEPELAASVIKHVLKPLVIGRHVSETEVLWHTLYNHTRDYGRKGVVIAGISAIDIALWDLKGKYAVQPTYTLLGGAFRNHIDAYATGFFRSSLDQDTQALVDEAKRHVDAGFLKMKIKLGFGIENDIQVMTDIRDAIGNDIELMVDVNHAYTVSEAARLAEGLRPFELRWLEEPVNPEDKEGFRLLQQKTLIPLAAGEAEFTMYGFRELLNTRCIDIAQPDVAMAGGLTALQHITTLALANGIQVNPHVWGTAIGQYASLHAIAATPTVNPTLLDADPILEYDTSAHPLRSELVHQPIEQHQGKVLIPQKNGHGFVINEDYLKENATLY